MTAALEGGEWSAARHGRTLPPGKTRYQVYRRLGGPRGRSGRAENLVPTRIRSRTVQPVAQSLYRLSYRAHYTYTYKWRHTQTYKNKAIPSPRRRRLSFLVSQRINKTLNKEENIWKSKLPVTVMRMKRKYWECREELQRETAWRHLLTAVTAKLTFIL